MGRHMLYRPASSRARLKRNHSQGLVVEMALEASARAGDASTLSPGIESSTSHNIKDRSRKEDQKECCGMPEEPMDARIQKHPVGTP